MSRRNIRERERPGPTGWDALALLRTGRREEVDHPTPPAEEAKQTGSTRRIGIRPHGGFGRRMHGCPITSARTVRHAPGRQEYGVLPHEMREGCTFPACEGSEARRRGWEPPVRRRDKDRGTPISSSTAAMVDQSQPPRWDAAMKIPHLAVGSAMPPRDRMTKPCPSIPQMGHFESSAITAAGDPSPVTAEVIRAKTDETAARLMATRAAHRRAGVPPTKPLLRESWPHTKASPIGPLR